jgi:glycosyltransferase involved in cell wall biosynthesis
VSRRSRARAAGTGLALAGGALAAGAAAVARRRAAAGRAGRGGDGGGTPHVLRLSPHYYWPQLAATEWPVKFDAIGGMQSQIYRLTNELDALGVRQTVLTLRIPNAPTSWWTSDHTEVRGVRVPVLPLRSRIRGMMDLNLSWALGVVRALVRDGRRPDVLHVHCSGVIIPPLTGWVLTRVLRRPLVLTLHCSIIVTYHPMNLLDRRLQPIAHWVERRAMRAAARVVTLTPRTIPGLSEASGIPAEDFVVLPDTIDADDFGSVPPGRTEELRERFGIPADRHVVGYVGRIAREKGWPIILDIAEALADEPVDIVVCGDGNERDLFEKDLERRGLTGRVLVTGYVPNEDVAAMMGLMDVLLMSSLHEEFGSVMLEAMATELPIIALDVGGVASVLDHGQLGWLVAERTADAFAEAIRKALADPRWRAETAARAAAAVRERYALPAVAAAHARLYEEVHAERVG